VYAAANLAAKQGTVLIGIITDRDHKIEGLP
jgi:hypothetical protein